MDRSTSNWKDLTAAPPGSPLSFPLIYSLIHLYCCHMASLSPIHPFATPSIIPLSLPPSSHIPELLLSGVSQSRHAPSFSHTLPSFSFLFPALILCIPTLLQQTLLSSFACAVVHSQGQHRSNLATVSIQCIFEQATKVLCHRNHTQGGQHRVRKVCIFVLEIGSQHTYSVLFLCVCTL